MPGLCWRPPLHVQTQGYVFGRAIRLSPRELAAGGQAGRVATQRSGVRRHAWFLAEKESWGSTAQGQPRSAEEAASSAAAIPPSWGPPADSQQLGELRVPQKGSKLAPGGTCLLPIPCPAGFLLAAKERTLKRELLKH